MSDQPTLFDRPPACPLVTPDRERSIEDRFWDFHEANPDVWAHLCRFAQGVVEAGLPRYSIKALVERVRYHVEVEVQTTDGFKINNNYTAYYARLLMEQGVVPPDFFATRDLRS